MTIDKYITNSEEQTINLGESFAERLNPGNVVALYGELGAGKTEFIKGVCKYFNVAEMVNSPTFTIINQYTGELNDEEFSIYHLDLYRIKDQNELAEIGFGECIHSNHNIKFIEWADKAKERLDNWDFKIIINTDEKDQDKREIVIQANE